MNRLMNFGLMRPSSSKASTLIGGKVGESLAGASSLGGEEGSVTFLVISVHLVRGVIPALPGVEPAVMVRVEVSSTDVILETERAAGGIPGEAFFRTANTFCLKGAPFFILQSQRSKIGKFGNTAK